MHKAHNRLIAKWDIYILSNVHALVRPLYLSVSADSVGAFVMLHFLLVFFQTSYFYFTIYTNVSYIYIYIYIYMIH